MPIATLCLVLGGSSVIGASAEPAEPAETAAPPRTAASAPPTAVASATPSTSPSIEPSAGTPTWVALDAEEAFGEQAFAADLLEWPDGRLTLIGEDASAGTARATGWTSAADAPWGAPSLVGGPETTARAIARSGSRVVVAGADVERTRALFWRSTDGTTWSGPVVIRRASAFDVVARGPGFIAVGARLAKGGAFVPTLWRSADGRRWRARPIANTGLAIGVVELDDGTLLVAGNLTVAGAALPVIWRSADGRRWTAHALPIADLTTDHIIFGFEASPAGAAVLLQWGTGDALRVGVFASDEGREWVQTLVPDRYVSALGGAGDAIVAIGPGDEWRTEGLTSWEHVDVPELAEVLPRAATETAAGGRVLAAQRLDVDGGQIVMYEAEPTSP
jgi:hypothetical protein